ncbi:MAG: hypothetical protein QXG00_03465 [Candidatus Woesearchaeota archaeon]
MFGLKIIFQFLKKKNIKIAFFVIIILLMIVTFFFRFDQIKKDRWEIVGHGDPSLINSLYDLGAFMQKNMAKNETVLSNDETGFMLAAISGRKVMLTRRTHANYYIDIDQRIADAVVAMYSNDSSVARDILKKYNVKYFYMDQYLFQSPMRVRADLDNYLIKYRINFTRAMDRYDIAVPPERANLRDLLIIIPQMPSENFLALWEKVYSVNIKGQVIGELYRLKEF